MAPIVYIDYYALANWVYLIKYHSQVIYVVRLVRENITPNNPSRLNSLGRTPPLNLPRQLYTLLC